jgi:hypothetical protein
MVTLVGVSRHSGGPGRRPLRHTDRVRLEAADPECGSRPVREERPRVAHEASERRVIPLAVPDKEELGRLVVPADVNVQLNVAHAEVRELHLHFGNGHGPPVPVLWDRERPARLLVTGVSNHRPNARPGPAQLVSRPAP